MFSQLDFGTEKFLCLLIHSLNWVWWEGCRCLINCQQEHLDISDQNSHCYPHQSIFTMKQKAAAKDGSLLLPCQVPRPTCYWQSGNLTTFYRVRFLKKSASSFYTTCHSSCWLSWYDKGDQHTSTWHQPSSSLELLDFYCDHQLFIMIKSLQCINVNHQCSSSMVRPGQLCISAVSHLTIIHPHSTH